MPTKLTLSLDDEIIQRTKKWAEKNKTSLSKLVENHFSFIVAKQSEKRSLAPNTKSLIGLFESSDKNLSYKELVNKYKGAK